VSNKHMAASANSMRPVLLMAFLFTAGAMASPAQTANAGQPKTSSGYRIAGTVVSKTDMHPLSRARIYLRDTKERQQAQSILTGDDGKFEFDGLPAGKYSLNGAKRGFISASYDQHEQFSTAIVTGAGLDTETLLLRLAPAAVITGKVLDEFGEPVRRAMVTLYRDDHSNGVDQIRQSRASQTDDLGAYELGPLMPGTYFVSASGKPWYAIHPNSEARGARAENTAVDRSLDVAYPMTYYADVTDADSATPILIQGGERAQVDIHLNPVPALHLLFHVPRDDQHGINFPQLQQPTFDGSTSVQGTGGQVVSPGLLEITGIPAGRYNVRMGGQGSGVQINSVDFNKDGEEVDTSHAEALSSVNVSVRIAGENTLPAQMKVGLRSGRREIVASQELNTKGEAELQQVPAGKYEVMVWGASKPYFVSRIAASGGEVSGRMIAVAAGSSPSISLTLTGSSVEVRGTVMLAGKPFAGAMVVLVPKNPEIDRDLFRRDQSDLDGTFTLREVIPGSYTVLAIQNGWDLDWSQPAALIAYAKHGQAVEIGDGSGRPVNLADAIEVQSK
jgi:carboxypeptidase family protein